MADEYDRVNELECLWEAIATACEDRLEGALFREVIEKLEGKTGEEWGPLEYARRWVGYQFNTTFDRGHSILRRLQEPISNMGAYLFARGLTEYRNQGVLGVVPISDPFEVMLLMQVSAKGACLPNGATIFTQDIVSEFRRLNSIREISFDVISPELISGRLKTVPEEKRERTTFRKEWKKLVGMLSPSEAQYSKDGTLYAWWD